MKFNCSKDVINPLIIVVRKLKSVMCIFFFNFQINSHIAVIY